eukprot:2510082-Pyramimonas_sp.AAC.1
MESAYGSLDESSVNADEEAEAIAAALDEQSVDACQADRTNQHSPNYGIHCEVGDDEDDALFTDEPLADQLGVVPPAAIDAACEGLAEDSHPLTLLLALSQCVCLLA